MIIAITGGIGSGKSVVSQVLRVAGYPVYDCDSNAKLIMNKDLGMQGLLVESFGSEIIVDGVIQRDVLAKLVFADRSKLAKLNSIVHPAVRKDIERWVETVHSDVAFVETAILKESGVDRLIDAVWIVEAPDKLRIARVMARNNVQEKNVRERIESQRKDLNFDKPTFAIKNDGRHSVLDQVDELLKMINN